MVVAELLEGPQVGAWFGVCWLLLLIASSPELFILTGWLLKCHFW